MKSFVPLALFGLLSSTGALFAQPAHEYWFLVENADHTVADFLDARSIAPEKHGLKRAWVVAYHSAKSKDYPGVRMSLLTEFNCQTGQSRSLQVTVNDSSGQTLRPLSEDTPADWAYVVPGSLGDSELRFVCAKSKKARTRVAVRIPAHRAIADVAQLLFGGNAPPVQSAASRQ